MSGMKCRVRTVEHAASCAECRAWLARQDALALELRELARDTEGVSLPAGLEAMLLAEFVETRRPVRMMRVWKMALAAAALVLLAVGVWRWIPVKPVAEAPVVALVQVPAVVQPALVRPVVAAAARVKKFRVRRPVIQEAPFFPIPFTFPLAPNERASVMRVDMPVSQLIAAGIPISVRDVGAQARADLVVGEDGRARAVRLIAISSFDSGMGRVQ